MYLNAQHSNICTTNENGFIFSTTSIIQIEKVVTLQVHFTLRHLRLRRNA